MKKLSITSKTLPSINRETLMVIMKIAALTLTAIILFFQDLIIIFSDALRSEATSYVLVIPFLLAYLVYRKRKMIKASFALESPKLFQRIPINEVVGSLLLLASFLLYWYGSYTFTPLEYHVLTLPVYVSACVLILFSTQTLKQLLFPIVFLFLLVPPPEEIFYNIGALLSEFSSELAYNLLKLFGLPVSLTAELGTPTIFVTQQDGTVITLSVDVACSGIYSLIGFLIFALFAAYIIRDKTWKKALVFFIGFPLIYLLNVFRITIMGVIGYYYGENLVLTVFHLVGGWALIFIGTIALLLISEKVLKISIVDSKRQKCEKCYKTTVSDRFCLSCGRILDFNPAKFKMKDLAKVVGILVVVSLVVSIQTPVFALTEGPPEIILQSPKGGNMTTSILPSLKEYTFHFLYRDESFEQTAGQDASLVYAYFPVYPYNETREPVWVSLEVASARSSLHRWETCLISWPISQGRQPRVTQVELRDVQVTENPPIIARYFVFNSTAVNEIQAVLYWYESAVFKINSTAQQKQVKMSLIAYPADMADLPNVENQLFDLATRLAGYWQPLKLWSQWSLLLSQNGDKLVILTTVAIAAVVVLQLYYIRKEKKRNTVTFGKLSDSGKLLIVAVHQAERLAPPTLNNIVATYASNSGIAVDNESILSRLYMMEKVGVVTSGIANEKDEPLQVWRSNVYLQNARRHLSNSLFSKLSKFRKKTTLNA